MEKIPDNSFPRFFPHRADGQFHIHPQFQILFQGFSCADLGADPEPFGKVNVAKGIGYFEPRRSNPDNRIGVKLSPLTQFYLFKRIFLQTIRTNGRFGKIEGAYPQAGVRPETNVYMPRTSPLFYTSVAPLASPIGAR